MLMVAMIFSPTVLYRFKTFNQKEGKVLKRFLSIPSGPNKSLWSSLQLKLSHKLRFFGISFFFYTQKVKNSNHLFTNLFYTDSEKSARSILKIPKSLIWIKGFTNEFKKLFNQTQVLFKIYMAYNKFALYFTWIDQIDYEIIINLFTQSFMSASLTQLCPSKSNFLRSNYPKHRFHKIQITVTFSS